jgi:hypothetical protein
MNIDLKDIIPLELKDLLPGYTFYRKESENDYARCTAPTTKELEAMSEHEKWMYRYFTKKYSANGRLFVNRNAPFKNFL